MKNVLSRLCALLSLALAIYTPPVSAQGSMEVVAGTNRFVDIPGDTVGVRPVHMAVSPDGFIYVSEYLGRLTRLDPATGKVTAMPAVPGGLNYNIGYSAGLAANSAGVLHVLTNGTLFRMNLAEGTSTNLGNLPASGAIAFAPTGVMYFVNSGEHRVFARSPAGVVSIVAGLATSGFSGDGGPAINAQLNGPANVVVAPNGDLFIADRYNQRIRKIAADTGIITTVGGGAANVVDGVPATQSKIDVPSSLALDAAGNLYVSGNSGYRIRRIDAVTNLISTVAGTGAGASSGDGGPATAARVASVNNLVFDSSGNLFFSDQSSASPQSIRKIDFTTGIVSRAIGFESVHVCGDGSPAYGSCLAEASGLDFVQGNLLITDGHSFFRVRKVDASGIITSALPVAGQTFAFIPSTVEHDAAGNLYLVGTGNQVLRRYAPDGTATILAGTGNGQSGNTGDGGPATAARLNNPVDTAIDAAGNVYISDSQNHRVRRIDAATGIISHFAGGTYGGSGSEGTPAASTSLYRIQGIEFDPQGNLLINDQGNCRLRRVNSQTGIINTILGTGVCAHYTQNPVPGTLGTATQISNLYSTFAIDAQGNIYFAWTNVIARMDAVSGMVSLIPTPPGGLVTPEGLRIMRVRALEFDPAGNLYVADRDQPYVFKISFITDTTPPVIQPQITGTAGNGGWYRSNVQVSWHVSDAESAMSSATGCGNASVTSDTDGVTFTCSASSAGGSATNSVTIRRDTVAPSIAFGAASPEAGSAGWHAGPVSVPFEASDALSGVFSTSSGSPLTISGPGAGLAAQVVVTDFAGNSVTVATPSVNIDGSGPVVAANVAGTFGNDDWYTSSVQVSWSVSDAHSPISATDGCDATTVNTDTLGITLTCTATSAGGSTTESVTLKRDATPPQLTFGVKDPLPYASGWNGGPVNIPFTTTDATSGLATTSEASPLLFAGPGANLITNVVVTDAAGNSATFASPRVDIDTTPPVIEAHLSGTMGNNGWYVSDVVLTWSETEAESHILSREGCFNLTLTGDAADYTFSCTVVGIGGTTTETVVFKRDATPPWLVFSAASTPPNAAGWHNDDVFIPFLSLDHYSGVVSTSTGSPVTITGEGFGLTTAIVVTDAAGNSATIATPAVNIDRSPPLISPVISGSAGNNGWYTSDVQVGWTINESPASIISSNGCENSSVIADTAGATFTCSVTSGGGTSSSSVSIKRDATPPVLSFGAPSPAPNTNGWNKTNVSIPFTRSDAVSGLASTSVASPLMLSTEGAEVTGQVVVTDLAGNSATFTSVPRNIDKTVPVVAITTPPNGATYGLYQDVIGDYSCTDLSVLSCVGPTAHGEPVNTKTAGARTFKVTGKDLALFTTAVTNSFTVESLFNFEGFLAPANEPPTLNLVTRGSLVPIRWRLPDGNGGYVTNTASFTSATVGSLTCGSATVVPLNDTASGPAGISFDAGTNTFTYNWQTNAIWTGCRKLTIKLRDNTLHELRFRFQ